MAKAKPPTGEGGGKPWGGRVRPRLAEQLRRLAERNDTDMAEELNRAVRELLEREGLWPPSEDKGQ